VLEKLLLHWRKGQPRHRTLYISLMSKFVSALYTMLIAGAISPFICSSFKNRGKVLVLHPSLTCFTSDWNKNAFFVYLFLFSYGIGYPVYVLYVLLKNRRDLQSENFRKSFGHLTSQYKDEWFFWELVSMLKKTSFAICSQITPLFSDENLTVYFAMIFLLFFFNYVENMATPFKRVNQGKSSTTWTMLVIILLMCDGFLFKSSSISSTEKTRVGIVMSMLIVLGLIQSVFIAFQHLKQSLSKSPKTVNVGEKNVVQQISILGPAVIPQRAVIL
jgi:hypothetical protein